MYITASSTLPSSKPNSTSLMQRSRFNLYALSYGFLIKKGLDTKRTKSGRWAFTCGDLVLLGVIWTCSVWVWQLADSAGILVTSCQVPCTCPLLIAIDILTLRATRPIPFLDVHSRSRTYRILPPSPATDDRRHLPIQTFLPAWRTPPPSYAPLPSSPQA